MYLRVFTAVDSSPVVMKAACGGPRRDVTPTHPAARWLNGGMEIGEAWAYRTRPRAVGTPVCRVEVVRIGGLFKAGFVCVLFIDGPEAGLHEWVAQDGLLVPWHQAEAFAEGERREAAVAAASRDARGSVEFAAAQLVLGVLRPKGRIRLRGRITDAGVLEIRDLDQAASRLRLNAHRLRREPLLFEDRSGRCLAPWPVALQVARHAARVYADDVRREADRRAADLTRERATGSTVAPEPGDGETELPGVRAVAGPRVVRQGRPRLRRFPTSVTVRRTGSNHRRGRGWLRRVHRNQPPGFVRSAVAQFGRLVEHLRPQ